MNYDRSKLQSTQHPSWKEKLPCCVKVDQYGSDIAIIYLYDMGA